MFGPADCERAPTGPGGLFYGVYPALVVDLQDPDSQGRVKIRLPWSPDSGGQVYEVWARVAVLMAGNNRGTWFIPDVNDEVLIAFEGGSPRRPYVLGGLWNGSDAPPEQMASNNNLKTILSREGVRMTMDDTSGSVKLRLETPAGRSVILDDGQNSITVEDFAGEFDHPGFPGDHDYRQRQSDSQRRDSRCDCRYGPGECRHVYLQRRGEM